MKLNEKKINDFYEHEGKLYIATDYGISVMDVATSEFIITYFIGTSGEETEVLQTTVLNNQIYAVTRSFGIRKGDLANPNLYDFSQPFAKSAIFGSIDCTVFFFAIYFIVL